MSNKNVNDAQNNAANNEAVVEQPKPVFDVDVQTNLLIDLLSKRLDTDVEPAAVIDNYIALMLAQFELGEADFVIFKAALEAKTQFVLTKSFSDYAAQAKEMLGNDTQVGPTNDLTGMGVEESKIFNFRNGVVGGAVVGAATAILTKGVTAGGLVGAGIGIVGSWFVAGAVEQKVNEVTENQYARTAGGVLLGAGIGSLTTLGGAYAQSFIVGAKDQQDAATPDHEAPMSELSW